MFEKKVKDVVLGAATSQEAKTRIQTYFPDAKVVDIHELGAHHYRVLVRRHAKAPHHTIICAKGG